MDKRTRTLPGKSSCTGLKRPLRKPRRLKNNLTNLKGTRIGFLYVIHKMQSRGSARWKVKCLAPNCGKILIVPHYVLMRSNPKTHCGCQRGGLPKKHPREYHSWWDAKNRCHNPHHPSYPDYGAKGIRMCASWLLGFEPFFQDMGPAPRGYTLDRKNPHGNYEPTNCRWADNLTQARNKKNSKYVKHPKTGERVLAAALADEMGVSYQQLRHLMIQRGEWYERSNNNPNK